MFYNLEKYASILLPNDNHSAPTPPKSGQIITGGHTAVNDASLPMGGVPEEVFGHLFCLDVLCICPASLTVDIPHQEQWPTLAKDDTNASETKRPVSSPIDLMGRIVLEALVPSLVFVSLTRGGGAQFHCAIAW